jgi:hypothetical protein
MTDQKRIVYFLILLFIVVRFFLYPTIEIIMDIIKLTTVKKLLKNMDSLLVRIPAYIKKIVPTVIWSIVMLVMVIFLSIIEKSYVLMLILLFIIPTVLDTILINKYSKYNGIYKNGIIYENPLLWKDIFSWKIINGNYFSILKKDGLRFDLPSGNKNDEIKKILVENGINEEA